MAILALLVLTQIFTQKFVLVPVHAVVFTEDETLLRIEHAAQLGVARGESNSVRVFDQNVRAMTEMQRSLAVGGITALLRFNPPGVPFPYRLEHKQILPGLIAQQTRSFSLWADRAAELRLGVARAADWRHSPIGRILRKLTDDIRDELLVVSEHEMARRTYDHAEFAGLTTFAREVAAIQVSPVIADALGEVAAVSPAYRDGRDPGPREYRVALIHMLGRLRALSEHLDAKICARTFTQ